MSVPQESHSVSWGTHRSNERDVSASCHTHVHLGLVSSKIVERRRGSTYHNFRRTISLFRTSGLSRPSSSCGRCSPRDCASRQVRPSKAHDASAFISLSSTKPDMSRAWIESKLGLEEVSSCRATLGGANIP